MATTSPANTPVAPAIPEIPQACVDGYSDSFKTITPTPRVPIAEIQKACAKICNTDVDHIQIHGHEVLVKHEVPVNSVVTYHYYVTQATSRSKNPWYQVPARLLPDPTTPKKIPEIPILCLFFEKQKAGAYTIYYRTWDPDKIVNGDTPWVKSPISAPVAKKFRWNPGDSYKNKTLSNGSANPNYMNKL